MLYEVLFDSILKRYIIYIIIIVNGNDRKCISRKILYFRFRFVPYSIVKLGTIHDNFIVENVDIVSEDERMSVDNSYSLAFVILTDENKICIL